jgi:hypothetical protein
LNAWQLALLVAAAFAVTHLWARRNRAARANAKIGATTEVESLLQEGEKLLWEGRPLGFRRPPKRRVLWVTSSFAFWFLVPFGFCAWMMSQCTARSYAFGFFFVAKGSAAPLLINTKSGVVPFVPMTYTFSWPNPILYFGFLCVVYGWDALKRHAAWRTRTYAITDRRALLVDRAASQLHELPRADLRSVRVEGRDLVLVGESASLRFEGIEDPGAACSALELVPSS